MRSGWTIPAIGIGGAAGATLRGLAESTAASIGCPTWAMIMAVNVIGCFAMGFLFVWLETRLRRDGASRLSRHPQHQRLRRFRGLIEPDPTIPTPDLARVQVPLQVASGLVITGFLGGLTTFSSYAIDVVRLGEAQQWWWMMTDFAGTIALGVLAVMLGMELACRARFRKAD